MSPVQAPSDLMYHTKRSSSLWINQNRFVTGKFSWQEGFGAFSIGKNQINSMAVYIENQQKNHEIRWMNLISGLTGLLKLIIK
jgi:REP element-mobilizing transposase RayT